MAARNWWYWTKDPFDEADCETKDIMILKQQDLEITRNDCSTNCEVSNS
jgi:hypothetical protein